MHDRNPKLPAKAILCTSIRVEQKQTVMHYQPQASRPFLRIGLVTPNLVPQCKSAPHPPLPPVAYHLLESSRRGHVG